MKLDIKGGLLWLSCYFICVGMFYFGRFIERHEVGPFISHTEEIKTSVVKNSSFSTAEVSRFYFQGSVEAIVDPKTEYGSMRLLVKPLIINSWTDSLYIDFFMQKKVDSRFIYPGRVVNIVGEYWSNIQSPHWSYYIKM